MDTFHHSRPNTAAARAFLSTPARPLSLLASCPAHQATPLVEAGTLATRLGLGALLLKDESRRMGLGSFKALGGAFAVAQMLREGANDALGRDVAGEDLVNDELRAWAAGKTFITASAGNHGLSVATGARLFGAGAVIVLSANVPEDFARRIEALGASVAWVEGSYEDSVAFAAAEAERQGWQHLADGSWPGYTQPPALVLEGYTVLAEECRQAFASSGDWPSHVLLQAGVGGLAAAVAAHIRDHWAVQPTIAVVEPDAAPCLMASARAGRLTRAEGPLSNMGRLDCKDASLIAFEALMQDADFFVTVSDQAAEETARALSNLGYPTTPSGAAGVAALRHAAALGIDGGSRCLAIISEQAVGADDA